MGLLDLVRRTLGRSGPISDRRFRAFDPRLAKAQLQRVVDAPFEWVEGSYLEGPIGGTIRMAWNGTAVVELNGVDGLRALLAQGRASGIGLEELVAKAAELVHLRIHRSRDAVAHLCNRTGGWEEPATAALLERFEPPHVDGTCFVFFAEASPRPFVVFGRNRTDIVRVAIDSKTLAVTAENIGAGPLHHSPMDSSGRPPPGVMMPGRALVADDGTAITAPTPTSASAEAAWWREQALGEHASIASFSRAALELMAAGAPLELLERLHQAALDEVRHTRECLDIAHRLDGIELTLGAVPALPPRPGNLAEIARRTLDEAAVPETVAARMLAERATLATDPRVRDVLVRQAGDEARHAQLAWDIVAWCSVPDAPS